VTFIYLNCQRVYGLVHAGLRLRHTTGVQQTLATVRKLLRPPLSPVDVATRLDGERPRIRMHIAAVGVPVEN
jgi:hypothetical protein